MRYKIMTCPYNNYLNSNQFEFKFGYSSVSKGLSMSILFKPLGIKLIYLYKIYTANFIDEFCLRLVTLLNSLGYIHYDKNLHKLVQRL